MVLSKVYVKIYEADGTVTEMKFSISKATMRSCKKIIEYYIEKMFTDLYVKEIHIVRRLKEGD